MAAHSETAAAFDAAPAKPLAGEIIQFSCTLATSFSATTTAQNKLLMLLFFYFLVIMSRSGRCDR